MSIAVVRAAGPELSMNVEEVAVLVHREDYGDGNDRHDRQSLAPGRGQGG